MFHLLVSYHGWPDSGSTMSSSRVYIRQDDPIGSTFYSNGQLDFAKLKELPALLVTETGGEGPQFAKVAHITNLIKGHSDISIQYAIDNSISPISNTELEGHAIELRLGRFGLSHTCWRVSGVRADDIWEHHAIIQDIVNIIARAKVVICDCSGKNPNVFYEAGIAHAIGKEVILITQSEHDVPFDLRHLRYIHYLPNSEGLGELSSSLQAKLRSIRGW